MMAGRLSLELVQILDDACKIVQILDDARKIDTVLFCILFIGKSFEK